MGGTCRRRRRGVPGRCFLGLCASIACAMVAGGSNPTPPTKPHPPDQKTGVNRPATRDTMPNRGLTETKAKPMAGLASPDEYSPLFRAAMKGRHDEIKALVAQGTSVEEKGLGGETALHWAAAYGHKTVAEFLVSKGADVNAADSTKNTSLHFAAQEGQVAVLEFLLAKGADVDANNEDGVTPLHLAAANGQTSIAQALLDNGASKDAKDSGGTVPLHLAAAYGHAETVRALVKRGVDTSIRDADGLTATELAAINDRGEVADLLADNGDIRAGALRRQKLRLAQMLADAGSREKAEEVLRALVSGDPNSPEAREAKRRLLVSH